MREASPAFTSGALQALGRRLLTEAGIESAAQETLWILEEALSRSRLELSVNSEWIVPDAASERALAWLRRRAAREPLQYILGTQEFCGGSFRVTPAVLIPRPETALLVDAVVRSLSPDCSGVMLDVGTGSGCVAVTLARRFPRARVLAVDTSLDALEVARLNAKDHGVAEQIQWIHGDMESTWQSWNVPDGILAIVSNPPYIPADELDRLQPEVAQYEPRVALDGGPDGLRLHRHIVSRAQEFLAAGGLLALEVGAGQAQTLQGEIERAGGYSLVAVTDDEAGIGRLVTARRL